MLLYIVCLFSCYNNRPEYLKNPKQINDIPLLYCKKTKQYKTKNKQININKCVLIGVICTFLIYVHLICKISTSYLENRRRSNPYNRDTLLAAARLPVQ